MTPEQRANNIVQALDDERRTGYVDEYEIIANAIREDVALTNKYEVALKKIAKADDYKGADSVSTKLGRAIDIARLAVGIKG